LDNDGDALGVLTCAVFLLFLFVLFLVVFDRVLDGADNMEDGVFRHPSS
jgi:hypothetical protein